MTANLTLYVNLMTVNSLKMLLFCNALGIKPNYKHIELHRGEQQSEQFLQLNPEGKVPVLVEGDFVLNESNAILQYLANKYQSPLWPSDMRAQGEVLKWLFWQTSYWNAAVGIFGHRRVVLPHWGFEVRQKLSSKEMDQFHLAMSRIDRVLTSKRALVGNDFSIADISLGSYLIFAEEAQIPLEEYINVYRWLDQLREMSWWQKTRQTLLDILNEQVHKE
ncbi:MAG: glutathione S-transferase family protein [Photobacterium frigidiphilum]|uniref:glutathione S-transferase family protein n=1 Tax=Photobacterium frigidiphilum TaxID=264736 RepID=UPI00300197EA